MVGIIYQERGFPIHVTTHNYAYSRINKNKNILKICKYDKGYIRKRNMFQKITFDIFCLNITFYFMKKIAKLFSNDIIDLH